MCSNSLPDLGKYALCEGSELCGLDYRFISDGETEKLRADFSRKDQLCVYKIVHLSESRKAFTLRAKMLKYVDAKLYS